MNWRLTEGGADLRHVVHLVALLHGGRREVGGAALDRRRGAPRRVGARHEMAPGRGGTGQRHTCAAASPFRRFAEWALPSPGPKGGLVEFKVSGPSSGPLPGPRGAAFKPNFG